MAPPLKPITDDMIAAVEEAIRLGAPGVTCADLCGVSHTTYIKWKNNGTALHDAGADPEPGTHDAQCLKLWNTIKAAKGRMVIENLALIRKAAIEATETTTTTKQYRDKDGNEVTETTTVVRKGGKWAAAAWVLERRLTQQFGRQIVRAEISGPDGQPIEVKGDTTDAIAAQVSAYLAGMADGALEPAEPVATLTE